MPTINVTVPLTPSYNSAYNHLVVIESESINLSIDLKEGTHTYTSSYQTVGTLKYFAVPRLEAAIRFTYTYNSSEDVLEVYGNDFVAADKSTCLLTKPAKSNQICYQHTYKNDLAPCGKNPNWNYSLQYTPGLPSLLTNTIRSANEKIIAAAKSVCKIVRIHTPPPQLDTIEDTHKWMNMHSEDGAFLGVYDPEKEYPEGTLMTNHIESTWGGVVFFNKNEHIANVIGSTPDPKLPGSKPWIELWERQFGLEDECTSHNWASGNAFPCNDHDKKNIVGGHVILGQVAKRMPNGSNNVYIIPICKKHNGDDSVYMRADIYLRGIWLNNYLN